MCYVIYKIWRSLENKRFVQFQTYGKNSLNFVFSQITFLYNSAPANHSVVFYGMVSIRKLMCLTSPICYFDLPFVFGLLVCAYQCVRVFLHLYVRTDVFTSVISFSWKQKKLLFVPKRAKSTQNAVFFSF